ncbi:MAG: DUF4142 domain-containing protein [Ferruginibacter sp.]
MKLSIKTFTILFAAATMYACNDSDTTSSDLNSDSTGSDRPAAMDTAHSTMTDNANSTTANADQDFLNFAIQANAKEMIWLKAGIAKGSKEVKQHANMMLKDHKKMEADIKGYMSKNPSFAMPALDTANIVNINDKTGEGWNKAWADKMVSDHNDLVDKFKSAQDNVKDDELKKMITKSIPVLESHLSMSKAVDEKLN